MQTILGHLRMRGAWLLVHLVRGRRGVSALEYAILVGVIATGTALGLAVFSGDVQTALSNVGDGISTTTVTGPGDVAQPGDSSQ